MINTKEDCVDSLVLSFNRAVNWRRSLQKRFPDDARNGQAAEILARLATEARALREEHWTELQPFYGWASQTWLDAVSDATRHVGFRRYVRTLDSFVQHLVGILTEKQAAA